MTILLMNLTVYPLLALLTLLTFVLFPPGFLLWRLFTPWPTKRIMRHFVWLYGQAWMWIVSPFVRFHLENMGAANIRPPCIVVTNHLSFFDTYCMAALPFSNVVFAVRAWPFKMPWYRPFMRLAQYLEVESWDWQLITARARAEVATGGSLVFFPEGHRSRDGKMCRFYSGAFRLAIDTGIPVVPVCITGTQALLPFGSFCLHPARIHLRALPAIDPRRFSGRRGYLGLLNTVREMMIRNVNDMTQATPQPGRPSPVSVST